MNELSFLCLSYDTSSGDFFVIQLLAEKVITSSDYLLFRWCSLVSSL